MLLMNLTLLQLWGEPSLSSPSVTKELKELSFIRPCISRDVSPLSPQLPPYLIMHQANKFLVSNLVKQDECILGCIKSIVSYGLIVLIYLFVLPAVL